MPQRSRVVVIDKVPFHASYTVDYLPDAQAFLPSFDAIHVANERGLPVGPNLVDLLDKMCIERGEEWVPFISAISFILMQTEAN